MSTAHNIGFILPIIEGEIFLAKRKKNPHKGKFGAVGGKPEHYKQPSLMKKILFNNKNSGIEEWSETINKEPPEKAALRELCEEIFADKNYPHDFNEDNFSKRIGTGLFKDTIDNKEIEIKIYACEIRRKDFFLKEDEIEDFKPLSQIKPKEIWPITQDALFELKFQIEKFPELFFPGELQPPEFLQTIKAIPNTLSPSPLKGDEFRPALVYYSFLKNYDHSILEKDDKIRDLLKTVCWFSFHKLYDYYHDNNPAIYNKINQTIREDYKTLK